MWYRLYTDMEGYLQYLHRAYLIHWVLYHVLWKYTTESFIIAVQKLCDPKPQQQQQQTTTKNEFWLNSLSSSYHRRNADASHPLNHEACLWAWQPALPWKEVWEPVPLGKEQERQVKQVQQRTPTFTCRQKLHIQRKRKKHTQTHKWSCSLLKYNKSMKRWTPWAVALNWVLNWILVLLRTECN